MHPLIQRSALVESQRTSLNGHGIFAIIVFAVVALICIQPVYVPVPYVVSRKAKALKERLVGDRKVGSELLKDNGTQTRSYITFNHVWTPAVGILFLLATKTIGGEQIKLGIVGEEGVEPYDVLIFFISLAYIAVSLDATGLLRYLAFQVCLKAGTNGMRLYLILYAFFWTLGVLVGNDPVILSGTAFLVYLTRVAGISPPSAWIWAQFVVANISSAVLVSSNPTNLVIASGFGISFPVYTAYMILPAFVSAAVALLVLLIFFRNKPGADRPLVDASKSKAGQGWTKSVLNVRTSLKKRSSSAVGSKELTSEDGEANGDIAMTVLNAHDDAAQRVNGQSVGESQATHHNDQDNDARDDHVRAPLIYIPKYIVRPDVNPREALVDPKGAIFVSVIMAATLATVIITNVTGGAKVYMVAAPGAGVCLVRDIIYDWYTWRSFRKRAYVERNSKDESNVERQKAEDQQVHPTSDATENSTSDTNGNAEPKKAVKASVPLLHRMIASWRHVTEDLFPTCTYVFARLPFPLLPFAFGMFILVESLAYVGFINIMAGGLGDVCGGNGGYVGCSFFISMLGVVLCNLGGTNIGATILLTRALQSTYFQQKLPAESAPLILRSASFAVAFGSNVGALGGTFAASLAGLLWRDGLLQRGVQVSKLQFFTWCAIVIVPATAAGIAVLIPEVRYFGL